MSEKAGIKTLRQRRIEQIDKFANKRAASNRFRHWFPMRQMARKTRGANKDVDKEDYVAVTVSIILQFFT